MKPLSGNMLKDMKRDIFGEHVNDLLQLKEAAPKMGLSKANVVLIDQLIRAVSGIACYELPAGVPEKPDAWCRSCGLPQASQINNVNYEYPAMPDGGCSNCGEETPTGQSHCSNGKGCREDWD